MEKQTDARFRELVAGIRDASAWAGVHLESDRYWVKTAESRAEILAALTLRHEVFFAQGLGRRLKDNLDIDEFDLDSDHLLVIEKISGLVIGNYRIRASRFHDRFYSEGEFDLGEYLEGVPGAKVEIGRACVHPAHRRGAVIQLLWRGLLEYMRLTEARHLFGCSSVPTGIPGQIEAVWSHLLENDLLSERFRALPRNAFLMRPGLRVEFEPKRELPPLLASYLRSGAKILGAPAHDQEFECADFLTTLDLQDLPKARARKFAAYV